MNEIPPYKGSWKTGWTRFHHFSFLKTGWMRFHHFKVFLKTGCIRSHHIYAPRKLNEWDSIIFMLLENWVNEIPLYLCSWKTGWMRFHYIYAPRKLDEWDSIISALMLVKKRVNEILLCRITCMPPCSGVHSLDTEFVKLLVCHYFSSAILK